MVKTVAIHQLQVELMPGIVYLSKTCREELKPELFSLLFSSHTIILLIMLTWLGRGIIFPVILYTIMELFYNKTRANLSGSQQKVWVSFSVSCLLPSTALILGIKCHCFDTKAQAKKWFLKGERAIRLSLDLLGLERVCSSVRTKKDVVTRSTVAIENSSSQVHQECFTPS